MFTVVGHRLHGLQVTSDSSNQVVSRMGSTICIGAVIRWLMACFDFGGPVNKTHVNFVKWILWWMRVLEPEAVLTFG